MVVRIDHGALGRPDLRAGDRFVGASFLQRLIETLHRLRAEPGLQVAGGQVRLQCDLRHQLSGAARALQRSVADEAALQAGEADTQENHGNRREQRELP